MQLGWNKKACVHLQRASSLYIFAGNIKCIVCVFVAVVCLLQLFVCCMSYVHCVDHVAVICGDCGLAVTLAE